MSGLLTLPRELRDEIYRYLQEYVEAPPENPSFPGMRYRMRDIMYPQFVEAQPAVQSLGLVCRQLRDELTEAMSISGSQETFTAHLDIMAKGYLYYPTWTYLPPRMERGRPFHLKVNLRIFSTESFHSNDGWPRQPGAGFRSLMHLLGQLIQNGPALFYTAHRTNTHRPFIIDRMDVNVSFHDHYTPATHAETARSIFRMLKTLANDGIAGGAINVIRARTAFVQEGVTKVFDRQWQVSDQLDSAKAREWGSAGFYYAALVV